MTRSKLTTPTNPAVQRMPPRVDLSDLHRSMPVTNSTSKGTYTGTVWNIRPGGEDHKKYKSKGW